MHEGFFSLSLHSTRTPFSWVFLYEKAYQVRDTAIESSVMTKVKGFGEYNNRIMDTADYVTPTQVNQLCDDTCVLL